MKGILFKQNKVSKQWDPIYCVSSPKGIALYAMSKNGPNYDKGVIGLLQASQIASVSLSTGEMPLIKLVMNSLHESRQVVFGCSIQDQSQWLNALEPLVSLQVRPQTHRRSVTTIPKRRTSLAYQKAPLQKRQSQIKLKPKPQYTRRRSSTMPDFDLLISDALLNSKLVYDPTHVAVETALPEEKVVEVEEQVVVPEQVEVVEEVAEEVQELTKQFKSLFKYSKATESQISLEVGDIINVQVNDGIYAYGTIGDKCGNVPVMLLEELK